MRKLRVALTCGAVVVSVLATGRAQERVSLATLARDRAAQQRGAGTWTTEQQWVVADISAAMQQMASFAIRPGAATQGPSEVKALPAAMGELARFDVAPWGGQRATVSITDHLWAPSAYVSLLPGLSGSSACSALVPAPVVLAMLEPRPAAIVAESVRISARLQADILCADAHHEAALLLGAFALREAAGDFSDTRRVLSRMTAHLAFADAAGPGPKSTVRSLAEAVLLTLVGRQHSALQSLPALQSQAPDAAVGAWVRALRLRNTFDWRAAPQDKVSTLLERLALLRALETSLGSERSLEMFDHIENPADVADWSRLILQNDPNVEAGNRFTEPWTAAELAEAAEVLHAFDPTASLAEPEARAKALNIEPGSGLVGADGVLHVIDQGTWAAATQRHLMRSIVARHDHLARSLALPGDARAFRDDASSSFSALRMYALAAVAIAFSRDEATRAFPKATSLVHTRPDLVTDATWAVLKSMGKYAVVPVPGNAAAWFTPVVPAGTAFEVERRARPDGTAPRIDKAGIDQLRARAPYARQLILEAIRWRGEKSSFEVLRRDYGEMAAYDLPAARALANAGWTTPEIYIPQMEKVCLMDPDGYWDLAPYLADHGRVTEARRAFEQWLRTGRNEVSISNSMYWLVRHYYEQGEQAKADEVADRVGNVGSYWGLVTRARLHDWRGELEQAERLHRQAAQRYDEPPELLGFYLRHGRNGTEVDELTRKVFPTGMMRLTLPASAAAPLDGVVIVTAGQTGYDEGLRVKDIVTAVDGLRVRNVPQYRAARNASADERIRISLWREGKPVEIFARLRYRWVVSGLANYQPEKTTK